MTHLLVTGANRGIGRELALAARARGWQVSGTTRGADLPEGVIPIRCDMTDIAGLSAVFAELPPLDILINNAGVIGPAQQAPLEMDFAGFQDALTVNTLAPLAVAQACLPALRARPGSRILSVSSQMSWMGYRKADRIAYRASKAALNKVMQGLATDLEPEGIAVALVDPGWVRTDMGGPEASEDPVAVAAGCLAIAERLTLEDTGRFFRFTGEERPF
ncbi:MAG: SDR family NAD(P)-dependent oxidoreductase [Silicimonas sp.]|nr:SDR family NAD(P)-dependent oxidoreductase [Silicimonas sp.]